MSAGERDEPKTNATTEDEMRAYTVGELSR
jgi:hypothetical protein